MPEQKNHYIAEAFGEHIFTAGIVRKHQEVIMQQAGFDAITFKFNKGWGWAGKIFRLAQALKVGFSIPKNSTAYFHLPYLAGIYGVLQRLLRWRQIKTIALIIDIDGLRNRDESLLTTELKQLSLFTCVVVHNEAMKSFLQRKLPDAKLISLQLFDYPFVGAVKARTLSNDICFAGNLAKSAFVYQLHQLPQLTFHLYGKGYAPDSTINTNVYYQGTVAPAEIPGLLNGSFGLVWDGTAIDTCDDYLSYNNPHKLSLYLTAGLPVIVWKQSAVANYVIANKIGFAVNNLIEVQEILQQLTAQEYATLHSNACNISRQLVNGFYLKDVLKQLHDTASAEFV